ncbi:MAG TPA: sigma-70 family RNA polymerase sigma factor [Thermoanaerobaculia bacterium]|nr:sigma-70 family RNA polymerase sigma factor [Thermoanaerobaculia bacterium]
MIGLAERNRAIERLVLEERGRIFRYLSALRVPPSNREDLLQAGLVLLLQKWDTVDDPFPWLLGALRNLHRTQIRDQGRRDRLVQPSAPPPSQSMLSISATVCTSDLRIDLTRWLLSLSRQQRVLVVRLVLFDEPPCEVAKRAGVKTASVQTLKFRSLKRLRSLAERSGAVRRALPRTLPKVCNRP